MFFLAALHLSPSIALMNPSKLLNLLSIIISQGIIIVSRKRII